MISQTNIKTHSPSKGSTGGENRGISETVGLDRKGTNNRGDKK